MNFNSSASRMGIFMSAGFLRMLLYRYSGEFCQKLRQRIELSSPDFSIIGLNECIYNLDNGIPAYKLGLCRTVF